MRRTRRACLTIQRMACTGCRARRGPRDGVVESGNQSLSCYFPHLFRSVKSSNGPSEARSTAIFTNSFVKVAHSYSTKTPDPLFFPYAQTAPGVPLPQNTAGILDALPSDVLAKMQQLGQMLKQNINEGKITEA